jgi:hypothetical protein
MCLGPPEEGKKLYFKLQKLVKLRPVHLFADEPRTGGAQYFTLATGRTEGAVPKEIAHHSSRVFALDPG